jgi:hypothetical protein
MDDMASPTGKALGYFIAFVTVLVGLAIDVALVVWGYNTGGGGRAFLMFLIGGVISTTVSDLLFMLLTLVFVAPFEAAAQRRLRKRHAS